MLEKLLALLLHAKGGAISAVFVLGATGALVTATTQNGVTTVTVTETSPSPTASPTTAASPATTVTASPTVRPSTSPLFALVPSSTSGVLTPSATPDPCKDEAKARVEALHQVQSAFSNYHGQLVHMHRLVKTDAARKAIEDGDKSLFEIRIAAFKAINLTQPSTCAKKDDDEDENEDEDASDDHKDQKHNEHGNNQDKHEGDKAKVETKSPKPAAVAPVTFTATDPQAIAQLAESAMKAAFEKAKAVVGDLPSPTPKHKQDGDKKNNEDKDKEHKGDHD